MALVVGGGGGSGGAFASLAAAALRAAARCRAALDLARSGGGGVDGGGMNTTTMTAAAGAATRSFSSSCFSAGSGTGSGSSSSSSSGGSGNSSGGSSGRRRPVVAVAMSGGVDSAVAALMVKRAGLEAFGVFMRNWDAGDEAGGGGAGVCTSERDLADARAVADRLGMPLLEADFVGRYWSEVFEGFLSGVSAGVTPNPDLTCNAAIKFGALWDFAAAAGADAVATGHYARLGRAAGAAAAEGLGGGGQLVAPSGARVRVLGPLEPAFEDSDALSSSSAPPPPPSHHAHPLLLRGLDASKDQSYFLASVPGRRLSRALFPVGHMTKAQTRALAAAEGLKPAAKRSSAGICFVGRRRSFAEFIEGYVAPLPGRFVDARSGADLGPCANLLALTTGQRAPLGGGGGRRYVAGRDLEARVAFVTHGGGDVCGGRDNVGDGVDGGGGDDDDDDAALLSRSALLLPASWVAGAAPAALGAGGGDADADGWLSPGMACGCQVRYRQAAVRCTVQAASDPEWRPGASAAAAPAAPGRPRFEASRFVGGSLPRLLAAVEASGAAGGSGNGGSGGAGGGGGGGGGGGASPRGPLLRVSFQEPVCALAPAQAAVMYDGPVVLGSALIAAPGRTVAEEEEGRVRSPIV